MNRTSENILPGVLLCLDTSLKNASLALFENGAFSDGAILAGKVQASVELLPNIEQLLKRNKVSKEQIGKIAVCLGPGSFTGLRVGIASAKGLAYALNAELFGISMLDALNAENADKTKNAAEIKNAIKSASLASAGRNLFCGGLYEGICLRREIFSGTAPEIFRILKQEKISILNVEGSCFEKIQAENPESLARFADESAESEIKVSKENAAENVGRRLLLAAAENEDLYRFYSENSEPLYLQQAVLPKNSEAFR